MSGSVGTTRREQPICPSCGEPLQWRRSRHSREVIWWVCPRYPLCTVSGSQAQNGRWIGLPADARVKGLRRTAHGLLSRVFGAEKGPAYRWLQKHTVSGHIGLCDRDELERVIDRLQARLDRAQGIGAAAAGEGL